jgi:hypothetical protein
MAAMLTHLSTLLSGTEDPFWPHVVLISTSVLAGIGVGAGIIFESHKYSSRTNAIATALVIIGVIIESLCTVSLFVIDEAISSAQQSKIIELEKRLAPRRLTAVQSASLAEKLKIFQGKNFILSAFGPESLDLALDIGRALETAGWVMQPWASGFNVASIPLNGVDIRAGSPAMKPAVNLLVSELKDNDIEEYTRGVEGLPAVAPNANENTIVIIVGPRR